MRGLPPARAAWQSPVDAATGCALAVDDSLWCWTKERPDPARVGESIVGLGGSEVLVLDRAGRLGRV